MDLDFFFNYFSGGDIKKIKSPWWRLIHSEALHSEIALIEF